MSSKGFTLIELSIVLVIIGLIVGGVLVGQDLISAARVRTQIKQLESYKLALHSFKIKYNCLPGDCASATAFDLGNNGNGNGILELSSIAGCWWITDNNYSNPDCNWNGEFPLFFQHLSAAKMIAENFDGSWVLGKGFPKVALNEATGMMVGGHWGTDHADGYPDYINRDYGFPSANGFWLHIKTCDLTQADPAGADEECGVLTPLQMQQIDTKIDDGQPLGGIFWGWTGSWNGGDRPAYCLNGTYTAYNVTANFNVCQGAYRLY